jgi:hypothetical protein
VFAVLGGEDEESDAPYLYARESLNLTELCTLVFRSEKNSQRPVM